ncbi:MAG: hypothetical protein R3A44_42165 [Caldilineaceae bacterium]
MNDEQPTPTTLILSRDELLCILGVLEAASIPGMDAEPGGPRTEQEQALVHEVTLRSLRARGIAAKNGDGALRFHDDLLKMVGACAYPHSALIALHWAQEADAPARFFGNVRNQNFVVHTRPEELLHRFVALPAKEKLFGSLFEFCQLNQVDAGADVESGASAAAIEFTISAAEFAEVRLLSEQGATQAAASRLEAAQVDAAAARAFSSTFAENPRLTVLQTVKQADGDTVLKRDFMLAQTPTQIWFMGAVDGEAAEMVLRVKNVTLEELQHLLSEWL